VCGHACGYASQAQYDDVVSVLVRQVLALSSVHPPDGSVDADADTDVGDAAHMSRDDALDLGAWATGDVMPLSSLRSTLGLLLRKVVASVLDSSRGFAGVQVCGHRCSTSCL
jgi:hypothetical protein